MGAIGKILTAQTIASTGTAEAKKVGKIYQNSANNKYSTLLGTDVNPSTTKMLGARNVVNVKGESGLNKDKELTASEQINELYKNAALNVTRGPKNLAAGIASKAKEISKKIDDIDVANTEHIRNAIESAKAVKRTNSRIKANKAAYKKLSDAERSNIRNFKREQRRNVLKESGKAALVTVPALGSMVLAGKGVTKGLEKLDKNPNQNERSDIEKKVIGGALTSALVANAIANKRVLKPFSTGLKSAKNSVQTIAENNIGRAVGQEILSKDPTVHMVAGVIKKPVGKVSKKFTAQRKKRLNQQLRRPTGKRIVNTRLSEGRRDVRPTRITRPSNRMYSYLGQKTNIKLIPRNRDASLESYRDELNNISKEIRKKMKKERIKNDRKFELEQIEKLKNSKNPPNINPDAKTVFKSHGDGKFIDYENLGKNETYKGYNKIHNKKASEEIDELYKTAAAVPPVPADPYVVELGKNFLKGGLESLPGMIAPATLGYLIHRDLKTMQKLKKENNDSKARKKKKTLKKVAFEMPEPVRRYGREAIDYMKKYPKKAGILAAKGLGSTLIPGTIIYMTGRNIGGNMEKIKQEQEREKELEKNELQEKNAQNEEAEGYDIGDVYEEINDRTYSDILGAKKLEKKPIHIGNGVKKTFRLNDGARKDDNENDE